MYHQVLFGMLLSGLLVLIISCLFVIWWWRNYRISMKWLWLGAGVWAGGVALKFVFAFIANAPILANIQQVWGRTAYLSIGSIYIGALTGVFEIGFTLILALVIRSMTIQPGRALGIGIGAGIIEAILIGLSQIGNFIYILSGTPQASTMIESLLPLMNLNPVFFLLAPVERSITIMCHISSRMLTLYAVAKHRYIYFWAGFLIMMAIDTIAGFVHLAGLLDKITMWWVELALLPFALVSILIIKWCRQHWPSKNNDCTSFRIPQTP